MDKIQPAVVSIWPDGAPGSEAWEDNEAEIIKQDWGTPVVHNVTQPSLTVYPAQIPNSPAVIVAPGGGFRFLMIETEGRKVAEWLCSHGITACLLKYRLIPTGSEPWNDPPESSSDRTAMMARIRSVEEMAHADGQQALRIVRQRAAEWGVDPKKVGIMGFSAGGVVASMTALEFTPDTRPDFAAVIYGAMFREYVIPAGAPPLFLAVAQDDDLASGHTVRMYNAWKAARLPVEMHIYASGNHGFGMRKLGLPCDTWIERFEDWLKSMG